MSDNKDNNNEHDGHGSCHGHSHVDENLNYPFHYHYELQKVMEGQEAPALDLPEVIFDMSADDVSPAHSKELMQFVAQEQDLTWVFIKATLNEEDMPVLYPSQGFPEMEPMDLEMGLDWLIDNGIHSFLSIETSHDFDETETTALVLDVLSRTWDEECPSLVITSSNPISLGTAQEVIPYWSKALVISEYFIENEFNGLDDFMAKHSIQALLIADHLCSEERIATLMDFDLPIAVMMGDDDVLGAKRLLKWGAESLICPTAHILNENL